MESRLVRPLSYRSILNAIAHTDRDSPLARQRLGPVVLPSPDLVEAQFLISSALLSCGLRVRPKDDVLVDDHVHR